MNIVFKRIFVFVISALFLFTTFFVLTFFNGYEFDFQKFKFVRSGSLYIQTEPKSSIVYLNDKKMKEITPLIINHLIPNKYKFRIEKEGYKTWENEVEIKPLEVSVFEYEMIKDDLSLTYLQNLSNNYFIPESEKYILYSNYNENSSLYDLYLYDFENNINNKIYELENDLEKVFWGAGSESFFLKDKNNNYFYYNYIDFINLSNNISIKIENIYPNLINENEIIVSSEDNIFILDLYSYDLKEINLDENYSNLLFQGDKIIFINQNKTKIFNVKNLELLNEFDIEGFKDINFIDDFFIISDYKNNLNFYDQNFKKIFNSYASDYKYNNDQFLIFNSSELKIFNTSSKSEILLSRYGNNIIDANFYKNDYIVYFINNNLLLKNIKY
ncbi:PEGA domain-containing protein, partial [bacterium]|nr:PEGA domain-containing protein [bacterium]